MSLSTAVLLHQDEACIVLPKGLLLFLFRSALPLLGVQGGRAYPGLQSRRFPLKDGDRQCRLACPAVMDSRDDDVLNRV